MKIIFDGTEWIVNDSSKNIVEIAKEHEIFIPAPCFFKKDMSGCCNGCLILVNGTIAKACETLPTDGMNIEFNRTDLLAQRERNLTSYALGIPTTLEDAHSHDHHHDHHHHDHSHGGCGDDCSCGGSCGDSCGCGSH